MLNLNSITRHQHSHWRDAKSTKIVAALEANNTWNLTSISLGKQPIGVNGFTKLDTKLMEVLRGIKLVYFETLSPIAKFAQWCLLAVSAINHWHLIQHDVNNVFLHEEA